MSGHHHHHGHDHGHGHAHGHGHSHAPANFDRAFAIGITINILYVVGEATAGLWTGSVALLADAGHNLSDVLGLAVAWGGATLARTRPTKRFTYGLKGSTILAALANALLLMIALGAIVLEAAQRFNAPPPLAGLTVSAVAGLGIVVNAVTAWLFAGGRHGDVNIRGAYLHMLADAAVSAGVVVAGVVIWWTGIGWIDPLVSIVIAALIFWQTWGLLRETVEMSLAAVPRGIDYDRVQAALLELDGVTAVHDLHIWPMSTTEPILTAHLVMPAGHPGDAFLDGVHELLHDRFGIGHATLQVESGDAVRHHHVC
ncbi:cobalt-zinc-cadmium efflux system protein [Sphingomonas sp. SORGH_AS802]|uniref:cation diffusion facilitator family transporter n=1 Tax=unclassified Sphingomonas TaxID=196159 RepID=UPI002862635C|nr:MULTISPECIES: cation diffusion facilitator family transporter [unclassified Sphingomonas]MDR6128259.1 cobalt-zinc-cadmium efflux system protein [Sphingomonas sp. SORGH_AS_0438]MDR6135537.1 cobalt-zinc-cadmium efflux system protein [Sphingomonas sp. SORGH_AS_0802]